MKDFKVTVPGIDFELESNKTYRIEGRVDSSSPLGFQEQGISKYQHPLNSEGAKPAFDSSIDVWDTGLYLSSPCYAASQEIGEKNIKIFEKYLLKDLKITLPEDALSPKSSNVYWDDYSFPINQPLTIKTSTPKNFLGLWFALLSYTVAPKDKENFPVYRRMGTSFTLVDRKEKSTNRQKTNFSKAKATASFINLLTSGNKEDKKHLARLLNYVGFNGNVETEGGILASQFDNWINNKKASLKNSGYFNDAVKKFSSELGKEELEIYTQLRKAIKKGKITYKRSEYYLGEESLSGNIKQAAQKVNESDELKTKFIELIDNEN